MPKTIKAAIAIFWFQIFKAVSAAIAANVMLFTKAESGFWRGFQNSFVRAAGAESIDKYTPKHAGILTGELLFMSVLFGLCLWSLTARRFLPVLIVTLLLVMAELGRGGFPFLLIVAIVLVVVPTGRTWLRSKAPQVAENKA